MTACRYLDGENITPATAAAARKLIGKRVEYLRDSDIDRSGRGYVFPRRGTIKAVHGRNIAIDHEENFIIHLNNLVDMRELP